jgi:selenocysteine-specific elongation factor
VGEWLVRTEVLGAVERAVDERLAAFHREHPLEEGAGLAVARDAAAVALQRAGAPAPRNLVDALLAALEEAGVVKRSASSIRRAEHRVRLEEHGEDVDRLLGAIGGEHQAQPPTVKELRVAGFAREVVDAAARAGVIVKVSDELVFTPELVARAEAIVRDAGAEGVTVSAFRERLGTSRKFALPLLEHFDRNGVTRRDGDRRFAR